MHEMPHNGELAVALRRKLDVDVLSRQLATTLRCQVTLATTEIDSFEAFMRNRGADVCILDACYPQELLEQAASTVRDASVNQPLLLLDDNFSPARARFAESIFAAYSSREISLQEMREVLERLLYSVEEIPSTANGLIQSEIGNQVAHSLAAALSERELEVMLLLTEGHTIKECAELMNLAESTVENHKFRLMRKLGVHRFTDVLRLAIRSGLISA